MAEPIAEKPPLNIVITGLTCSGKTTVSRIVAKALRDVGFEVTNLDPDDQSKEGLYPIEVERIKKMAKGRKVKVTTVQLQRIDIRQKLQESGERWGALVHKAPSAKG